MISDHTKEWLGIFRLHRSDTFRKLFPIIVFLCVYTAGITYLELTHLELSDKSQLKNIPVMHSLLGFALSMLLVFRTNTAYDRWWEGRKLWGSLVNNSRNLAVKLGALLPAEDRQARSFFAKLISSFAAELMRHLRLESTRYELDEEPHPEIPNFDTTKHVPNQVAGLILQRLYQLEREGKISGEQLLTLNPDITSFLDICGACERIRNTPIPLSYSSFIKKFIFVFVITLPFGFVFNLGYISIPIVAFIFYVLASLELIAEEIEEPFGVDANDIPMAKLCETIRKNVYDILI